MLTQCRTEREPGRRIKHRRKGNWLKLYDKFGLLLRVERVINQPGEFKVYRECPHRDGTTSTGWYPMTKGVGNLHHDQAQARACKRRYLEALAAVDDPTPAYEELRKLTKPTRTQGRSSAGFHPARQEEDKLLAAVLEGEHIAQGFRNQDIRLSLYGATPSLTELDPKHGDLKVGLDFRQIYAMLLADWLGLPVEAALGGPFERLPLLKLPT